MREYLEFYNINKFKPDSKSTPNNQLNQLYKRKDCKKTD